MMANDHTGFVVKVKQACLIGMVAQNMGSSIGSNLQYKIEQFFYTFLIYKVLSSYFVEMYLRIQYGA